MTDLLRHSIPRSVWHGWGDPTEAHPLSKAAWRQLRDEIGADPSRRVPPVALDDVELAPSRLESAGKGRAARDALVAVVSPDHVHTDREWRVGHAGGKSYPDLYRLRTGDGSNAPDAVVVPGSADEVQRIIDVAVEHHLAIVPFGGGTSVVGGVGAGRAASEPGDPFMATVTLDLRRLDRLVAVDPRSRTATFEPGLRGPEIEQALHPHGFTLGHYPQSHQEATLGGYVATRSAGQASTGYGRIDDNVLGVRLATPRGEFVVGGRSPGSATGPRLLDVVVGSEGALGIITEATLAVAPVPTEKRHAAWFFESFEAGAEAVRHLVQDAGRGIAPDVCRLSDEDETRVNLTLAGRLGRRLLRYAAVRGAAAPALLVTQFEGTDASLVRHRARASARVLERHGAHRLPRQVGQAWEKGRFAGPYLRDELMDHRVLADTLETGTMWSNLADLHSRVAGAIRGALEVDGRRAIVMCHVSHVYGTGASLYYTFIAPESDDPIGQWQAVKAAASDAIIAGGGTISHHHSIGTDHREHLAAEVGETGVGILRAIKAELDPAGILNPGKLIP